MVPDRPGSLQQHRPRQRPRHPRRRHHRRRRHDQPGSPRRRPGREACLLRNRRGDHHHRRRDGLRLHAAPAEDARDRRHQQLVGQQLPPVRPEGPGQRRHPGGHRQGRHRGVLRRQLRRRERRGERQPVQPGTLGDLGGRERRSSGCAATSPPTASSTTTCSPRGSARGGHTVAFGDRTGLTWPDISAPGVSISSSCDTTGTVIGPCPPGENDTASGTSMASPHIAGAAAVVTQANGSLSPAQVQDALTATASAVLGREREAGAPVAGRLRPREPRPGRRPGPRTRLVDRPAAGDQAGRTADAAGGRLAGLPQRHLAVRRSARHARRLGLGVVHRERPSGASTG